MKTKLLTCSDPTEINCQNLVASIMISDNQEFNQDSGMVSVCETCQALLNNLNE